MLFKFSTKLSLLAIFSSNLLFASILDDSNAVETNSISLKDLKIYHQYEWRNLSIILEYQIAPDKEDLDTKSVKNYVVSFLKQYKNPEDFWEIMDNKIVKLILRDFPDIQTMKSTFLLKPDKKILFSRFSSIYYDRANKKFIETFGFDKENFAICNETFKSMNLSVSWSFKDSPKPNDYFKFEDMDEQIIKFFKENPLAFSKWEYLKPKLEKQLLEKFESINSVNVNVTLVN